MSTLLNSDQAVPLYSENDLLHYFESFAKCRECMRIGLEAEFFAVYRDTGKALPYEGETGIKSLLTALSGQFGYERITEGEAIIALKKAEHMITLEPGGQIELSAPPVVTAFEVQDQLKLFLEGIDWLRQKFPAVEFLACGLQPFSGIDEVSWVPKKRYSIMAEYLSRQGALAHHMMKLTATNQINLDYYNEEHAMSSLRTAFGVTPIISAMFCNSPFSEGKPNGYLSKRLEIWRSTDPRRTGILPRFLEKGAGFKDYLEYILEMPMIFIVRDGVWIPMKGETFRSFLKTGYGGMPAAVSDFELHLSTAFPEVRIKQYIEVRGMDGQRTDLIPALAAFWRGLFYDAASREEAWNLVSYATIEERAQLAAEVPTKGLRSFLGKKPILDLARDLVELSCSSLSRLTTETESRSDCIFLNRLREEIIEAERTPAERLLAEWHGPWNRDPRMLIKYLSL